MEMELKTIGRNIRKARKAVKLRQEDLAEKAGLSSNYIGMVERGEKIPSLETFIKILNTLGTSADLILSDVIDVGYSVKNSVLTERMQHISCADRQRIYAVIDVLLRHATTRDP